MANVKSCAVLFGTPVSREEVEEAARPGRLSDYIAGQLRGGSVAELWSTRYCRTAAAAQQLERTARELAARVYRRATLADFAEATRLYPCVIVFAHWRGVIFVAEDLQANPDDIADRIRSEDALRSIKLERPGVQPLLDALNAAVTKMAILEALPETLAHAGRRTSALGVTICRDLIDERLDGFVKPGNRMEFFDGLHTPSDVELALWNRFDGELDLEMCNSAALATLIDMRRGCALRHLHWPKYVLPTPQYLKVEQTLREVAANGDDYIPTRLSIEERERGRKR